MEDNKKDDSDFFKQQPDNDEFAERREEQFPEQERTSYYYSYGPNKSNSNVEVTPPRQLRPFGTNTPGNETAPVREWQFENKRRSSARSMFAAFMAGVLVVGSLMFASDKMNLFSGSEQLVGSGSPPASSGPVGGGATNVALDIARPGNISQMVQNASPAVVKVEAFVKPKASSRGGNSLFDDPFFRQFFGDDFGGQRNSQPNNGNGELQPAGMGTGFIFEKSGYILTNEHVVDGADEIRVTVQGYDKPFVAKLLGNSFDLDLAALKIEGDQAFPILPMSNADNVNLGEWVVAIGNPYGFDHTVTVGVLSAKERSISIPDNKGTREYKHLLQTDASINPGNSGGPLLNLNGEVIGINTAVSAQAQGIGFAIPTSTISSVLDNLKNNVKIPKTPVPYIGVGLQNIDKEWVSELKLENTDGALVGNVERRSPAFDAGLRQYDVIVEVNGAKVKNTEELITKIQSFKVGEKISLGIIRNGNKQDVSVTIGDKNILSEQQQ